MSEIENTIGWGQGSVDNTIGWGQAQEAWCEPPAPSAPATVKNSDETYNTTVACGGTLNLPDITVTDSNGSTFTSPSAKNITCTPASAPVGATLMKTGQTISYRTGDDGDLEAGRATDFFTLASNNPFGNTNRFTDELGGSTYANNIVIDWSTYNGSTVLGYKRTLSGSVGNWNTAIDGALAVSIASFTSGWRCANIRELQNIDNWSMKTISFKNYSPFNISQQQLWSSTSLDSAIASNYAIRQTAYGSVEYQPKANNSGDYIAVRTFTVTGTTLT